jgi:hypothetical protein
MMRLIRPALRRCGIPMAPASVICPEHMKTICIDPDGRARVDVRETLVFLHEPQAGDLSDTCSLEGDTTLSTFIRQSPDATDTARRLRGRSAIAIDWKPRNPVVRYALYDHQFSWLPSGSHSQPALCAEFVCEKRTGNFVLEMISPQTFEAAVAFPRPGWSHMRSERTLIKYALKKLEGGGEGPAISEDGQRLEWKIVGPRLGRSYVCVVFHRHGVALWQEEIKKGTLRYKIGQMMGRFAPSNSATS